MPPPRSSSRYHRRRSFLSRLEAQASSGSVTPCRLCHRGIAKEARTPINSSLKRDRFLRGSGQKIRVLRKRPRSHGSPCALDFGRAGCSAVGGEIVQSVMTVSGGKSVAKDRHQSLRAAVMLWASACSATRSRKHRIRSGSSGSVAIMSAPAGNGVAAAWRRIAQTQALSGRHPRDRCHRANPAYRQIHAGIEIRRWPGHLGPAQGGKKKTLIGKRDRAVRRVFPVRVRPPRTLSSVLAGNHIRMVGLDGRPGAPPLAPGIVADPLQQLRKTGRVRGVEVALRCRPSHCAAERAPGIAPGPPEQPAEAPIPTMRVVAGASV